MDLRYISLILLFGFSQCELEDVSAVMFKRDGSSTAKVYCGKQLSQTLSTVCQGNYNTLTKKSDIHNNGNPQYSFNMEGDASYPYKSKAKANTLIGNFRRRRRRRGVYNECCEKACSIEELRSYCGA